MHTSAFRSQPRAPPSPHPPPQPGELAGCPPHCTLCKSDVEAITAAEEATQGAEYVRKSELRMPHFECEGLEPYCSLVEDAVAEGRVRRCPHANCGFPARKDDEC